MFDEIPNPREDSYSSWWQRNWAALVSIGYSLTALIAAVKWFRFHSEDQAIDAVLYFFLAIAFALGHLNNRSARRYINTMKRVKHEHPFPWENDIKASK